MKVYQQLNILASTIPTGCTKYFDCPECGREKKLGMTNKTQGVVYQCFAASCSIKGIITHNDRPMSKASLLSSIKGLLGIKPMFTVPNYLINGFASEMSLKMAMQYDLIKPYTEDVLHTAYDPKLMRQVFFHKDLKGKVVGAFGRALLFGVKPKSYIYPNSIKTPIVLGESKVAVVVEDMFSAVRVYNSGSTGISLSGTAVHVDYLDFFKGYDKIIIALDKDATVKSLRAKKLLKFVCNNVIILPLQKDIKDMTHEEVIKLLA